jgi:phenylalanyl-tRNA synthetase alpha subunit
MSHPLEKLRDSALTEIATRQTSNRSMPRVCATSAAAAASRLGRADEDALERGAAGRRQIAERGAERRHRLHHRERRTSAAAKEASELGNIDISLPGTPVEIGALHPLTQMLDRAIAIFRRMGFALAEGPDVDSEWYCFDALNTAPDHPARNEQDTFYLARRAAAPHPHLDGADPRDAIGAAADPRDRARRGVSA